MSKQITHRITYLLIFLIAILHTGIANENPIENVAVDTDDRVIEILYDLLPQEMDKKYTVTLEISDDGGRTYTVTPHMITGDVGRDILPGRNKRIVWMIERDFPDDVDLDRYDFRITAKRQGISRNLLYMIAGAVVAGGGTAAYLIFGGSGNDDNGETEFPGPPGRPE